MFWTQPIRQLHQSHPFLGQIAIKAISSPFYNSFMFLTFLKSSVYLKTFYNSFIFLKFLKTSVYLKMFYNSFMLLNHLCTWKHSSNQGRQFHLSHPSAKASVPKTTWPARAGSFICHTHLLDKLPPRLSHYPSATVSAPEMPKQSPVRLTAPLPLREVLEPKSPSVKIWSPKKILREVLKPQRIQFSQEIFTEAYASAIYSSSKSTDALPWSLLHSYSSDTAAAPYNACTNHPSADRAQALPTRVLKQVPSPVTTL